MGKQPFLLEKERKKERKKEVMRTLKKGGVNNKKTKCQE